MGRLSGSKKDLRIEISRKTASFFGPALMYFATGKLNAGETTFGHHIVSWSHNCPPMVGGVSPALLGSEKRWGCFLPPSMDRISGSRSPENLRLFGLAFWIPFSDFHFGFLFRTSFSDPFFGPLFRVHTHGLVLTRNRGSGPPQSHGTGPTTVPRRGWRSCVPRHLEAKGSDFSGSRTREKNLLLFSGPLFRWSPYSDVSSFGPPFSVPILGCFFRLVPLFRPYSGMVFLGLFPVYGRIPSGTSHPGRVVWPYPWAFTEQLLEGGRDHPYIHQPSMVGAISPAFNRLVFYRSGTLVGFQECVVLWIRPASDKAANEAASSWSVRLVVDMVTRRVGR